MSRDWFATREVEPGVWVGGAAPPACPPPPGGPPRRRGPAGAPRRVHDPRAAAARAVRGAPRPRRSLLLLPGRGDHAASPAGGLRPARLAPRAARPPPA